MSQSSAGGVIDAREPATPSRGEGLPRVMYVDDEPRALSTLTRVLKSRFAIVTSDNGAEALAQLERAGDFAVVIADVSMPRMNGFEFLDRVKEASPTTARLALTGLSSLDSGTSAQESVFRVLRKPCPSELLFDALAAAVQYHELLSASPFQPVEAPRHVAEQSPNVPRRAGDSRLGLRLEGRTIELLTGDTIVGRSRACHIPIDDAKVSRRHACFTHDERQLTVRALHGTHSVLLNGAPLDDAAHALQIGDRVVLGSYELEVCSVGDYLPSLGTVADVAQKFVRLGHGQDAERILRPPLEGLLRFCRAGGTPLANDVKLAAELALGIAESTRAAVWVRYVFELLAVLEQVPDQDLLERLYRCEAQCRPISDPLKYIPTPRNVASPK
jgi:CheY-like chemotaxis protein